MKTVTSIWNAVTRHSVTLFRVTLLHVQPKNVVMPVSGVNNTGLAVFLDFKYAIDRLGEDVVRARYGNLFDMYEEITDENPYKTPMMIFPRYPLHHGWYLG